MNILHTTIFIILFLLVSIISEAAEEVWKGDAGSVSIKFQLSKDKKYISVKEIFFTNACRRKYAHMRGTYSIGFNKLKVVKSKKGNTYQWRYSILARSPVQVSMKIYGYFNRSYTKAYGIFKWSIGRHACRLKWVAKRLN